jgi:hypothetical protein
MKFSLDLNSRLNEAQWFTTQFMQCIRSIVATSYELYGTTAVD